MALWALTDGGQTIVDRACGAGAGGPEVPARVALSQVDGKFVHIELPDRTLLAPEHEDQIDNVISNGTQVLIPPDAGKRGTPRPGCHGGRYAWMRNVLATDHGGGLYRRRKTMVEPVFAQTKHNRRIDRFQRRGRSAVRSEWA